MLRMIGYTLAPDATLDQIVAEIHRGLDFLAAKLPALGGDPNRIVVSGWSAGGHLTSMALSHPHVKAGMAISGIYELEPIRHSYLNVKLGLDQATSRHNSPMMQAGGVLKPLSLVVGSAELPLLRKQTADFAGHRAKYGLPVTYEEIPGANHFSIMDELVSPTGRITTLIRQLFERTVGAFPGRSAARSPCGAVRCRAGAVTKAASVTIPGSAKQHCVLRLRGDDAGRRRLANCRIQISNSQALSFSRRRASWAFSFLPFSRGDGAPNDAPW